MREGKNLPEVMLLFGRDTLLGNKLRNSEPMADRKRCVNASAA